MCFRPRPHLISSLTLSAAWKYNCFLYYTFICVSVPSSLIVVFLHIKSFEWFLWDRYDGDEDRWELLSPLLTPRADHTMLSYKGRLYVCGGWLDDELTGNRVSILQTKVFFFLNICIEMNYKQFEINTILLLF